MPFERRRWRSSSECDVLVPKKILRPPLRIESPRHRDGLEQCGFGGTVFSDEGRDIGMKLQPIQVIHGGQRERITLE
jgi:hypothetical protein